MEYFEEAKNIWRTFVPESGQAETVQGELLRAVEKLRIEALDNGNGNWDTGFDILLEYLEQRLLDNEVYSPEKLNKTKDRLMRLRDFDNPYLKDDLYDDLADRVVEYYKFYGNLSHAKNEKLYC